MTKIFLVFLLAIAASCECQTKDDAANDELVIINIGKRYRLGIAQEIAIINSLAPKVVALDTYFPNEKDQYSDSLLISTLNTCKGLVMMSLIKEYTGKNDVSYNELDGSLPKFLANSKIGFANSILENDQFQTLKRFSIYEKVNNLTIYHFAVRASMEYDSLKTMEFISGKPRVIDVEYIGDEKMFKTFSDFDVFNGKVRREDIEGKIVLFGYIGPYEGYTGDYDEDKFFSPLNGRMPPYKPDMYGVVFHANIIAQILRQKRDK